MRRQQPIFQVSELADELRRLIETSYPEIWIEGELSSLSAPASGHLYFSLKDDKAQLRCAMFKGRASISKYRPKSGDLVRVRAKLSVYTARGDLQCIVQHIEEAGEGLLQRRYEELKAKLNSEGLFEQSRKKNTPQFPNHIGIITSATGAAVKDILSTLARRCPGIPVTIFPAVVQGDEAAKSLIKAIDTAVAYNQTDVLIVSRGGGSLEDLWCFNDEQLARTISACPLPIVSGVGHEVDVTIADLVADLRAPTPTAAAELLSPNREQVLSQIDSLARRLQSSFKRFCQQSAQTIDLTGKQLVHPQHQLQSKRQRLNTLAPRMTQLWHRNSVTKNSKLEEKLKRLDTIKLNRQINRYRQSLAELNKWHLNAMHKRLKGLNVSLQNQASQLNAISPLATLERGFSISRSDSKKILRDATSVKVQDQIEVELAKGRLVCDVVEIKS